MFLNIWVNIIVVKFWWKVVIMSILGPAWKCFMLLGYAFLNNGISFKVFNKGKNIKKKITFMRAKTWELKKQKTKNLNKHTFLEVRTHFCYEQLKKFKTKMPLSAPYKTCKSSYFSSWILSCLFNYLVISSYSGWIL